MQQRRTKAAKQLQKSSNSKAKAAKKQHTSSSSNLEYGSASLSLSYSTDTSSQLIEDGPTVVTATASTTVVEADLGEQLAEYEVHTAVDVEASQQATTSATTSSSSAIASMADIEESVTTATAATTPQSVAYSSPDEVDEDELHSSLLPSATTTEAPNTMEIMSNITFDDELSSQSHVNHSLSVLMKDSQSPQQANALGSSLARNKSTYGLSMTMGIALAATLMFLFALTRVSKYRHQRRLLSAADSNNDDVEHVIDDMEANYASGRNEGAAVQLQGDYPGDDASSIWSADEDDDDEDDDDNVTAEDAGNEQDFVGDVYCDDHVQDNGNNEEQEDPSSLPNTGVNEAAAAADTTATSTASQIDSPNSIQMEALAAYTYDVNTPGDMRDLRVELGDESPSSSDGKESEDDSTLEYDLETPRDDVRDPYPAWWAIGSC